MLIISSDNCDTSQTDRHACEHLVGPRVSKAIFNHGLLQRKLRKKRKFTLPDAPSPRGVVLVGTSVGLPPSLKNPLGSCS